MLTFIAFRQLVIRTPEEMKELGNTHYKEKNYTEALSCYTQAISKIYDITYLYALTEFSISFS